MILFFTSFKLPNLGKWKGGIDAGGNSIKPPLHQFQK